MDTAVTAYGRRGKAHLNAHKPWASSKGTRPASVHARTPPGANEFKTAAWQVGPRSACCRELHLRGRGMGVCICVNPMHLPHAFRPAAAAHRGTAQECVPGRWRGAPPGAVGFGVELLHFLAVVYALAPFSTANRL